MNFCSKLECISPVCLSSLVICLWAKAGAYPRVVYLKGASLRVGSRLTLKHHTILERLARDEHSSLLQTIVNY